METFSYTHIIVTEHPFRHPFKVGDFVEKLPANGLKSLLSPYADYKDQSGKIHRLKKTDVAAVTFYDGPVPPIEIS